MASRGTVGNLLVSLRADLSGLKIDIREMERSFSAGFANIKSSAASFGRELTGSIGVALSVGALVQFGRSVVNLAGQLSDLSSQTGISGQALSGLKSTFDENGSSIDALATGMFRLQKELLTIKTDSDPVAQAFKALGLNYKELGQLGTEDLLKTITEALAKQEDVGRRNAIAYQLMSRSARELVPGLIAIAGRFDELKAKGMNDKDIKTLDDFGDAITRLGNIARIVAAGPLADFVSQVERLFGLTESGRIRDSMVQAAEEVERLEKMLASRQSLRQKGLGFLTVPESDDAAQITRLKEQKARLADLGAELGKLREGPKKAVGGSVTPLIIDDSAAKKIDSLVESLRKQLIALQAEQIGLTQGADAAEKWKLEHDLMIETGGKITPTMRGLIDQIVEIKGAIDAFKMSEKALTEQFKVIDDEEQQLIATTTDFLSAMEQLQTADMTPLQKQFHDIGKTFDDLYVKIQKFGEATGQDVSGILGGLEGAKQKQLGKVLQDTSAEWMKLQQQISLGLITDDVRRQVTELTMEFIELAKRIKEAGEAAGQTPEVINAAISNAWTPFMNKIKDIKPPQTEAEKIGAELGNALSQGLKNTLLGIETGQTTLAEGMKNLLRNMLLEVQGMILDKAFVQPLAQAFSTWISEALKLATTNEGGSSGGWIGSLFGFVANLFGGLFGSTANIPIGGGGFGSIGGPTAATGGLIKGGDVLSFASGGMVPIMAHQGEFVMNRRAVDAIGAANMSRMNQSGQIPSGATQVVINGDIIPRQPNLTKDEVIHVVTNDFYNRGPAFQMNRQQSRG